MAYKLVFDKLKTQRETIEITFDGTNYNPYNVALLKENGLEIPEECENFDNIKIKDQNDNEIGNFYYLIKNWPYWNEEKIKRVKVIDELTAIDDLAFSNCNNLIDLILSTSITSIGEAAFAGCNNLTEITIPNSVTFIGKNAFTGCKSIILPNSITNIGNYALAGSAITEITIPESVTEIYPYAFYDSDELITVNILNPNTILDDYSFAWCNKLTTINFAGTEE